MDRNLALESVRLTEASALASARWMGKGDGSAAGDAAIKAMHRVFSSISINGRIVIGEGEQGEAAMLYAGERVGCGVAPDIDIALDPLECTNSVAFGRSNAMAIIAMVPRDHFISSPVPYMDKLAVGPDAAGVIDLNLPPEENMNRVAEAKRYKMADLTVAILERDRHTELVERVRKAGARIHLISDGDISAAIATALPGTGIDILMGIGGSSEGVLAAAALRCIGGEIHARFAPRNDQETKQLKEDCVEDENHVYKCDELARGENVMFAATGVTDGDLLNGVRYRPDGATTHSLVLRAKSSTRRFMVTEHYFEDKPDF